MMSIRPFSYVRNNGDVSYPLIGLAVVLVTAAVFYGGVAALALSN